MVSKHKYADKLVDDTAKDTLLLLKDADQYYKAEQYKKAFKIYQHVLRLDPGSVDAYVGKGNSLFKQKKFGEAQNAYVKALSLDAQNTSVYNGLGYIHLNSKKYEKALAMFGQAIKLDPKNAIALNGKGYALRLQRKYNEALYFIEEAIKRAMDADNIAEYYYHKSIILYELQQLREALTVIDGLLELKLNTQQKADAYIMRGNILLELTEYTNAIQSFKAALPFQPDPSTSYLGQGKAFFHLGHFEEAIEAFKKALRFNNKLVHALVYKGHALFKLERNYEAIEAYNQAILLNTDDINCYLNAGDILAADHIYKQALQMYQKAQLCDPESVSAYLKQAQLYVELQDYEVALFAYQHVITIDKSHTIAYWKIADVLAAMNRFEAAEQAYEEAFQLIENEQDIEVLQLLSKVPYHQRRPIAIQFRLLAMVILRTIWNQQGREALDAISLLYEKLFDAKNLIPQQFSANIQTLKNMLVQLPDTKRSEVLLKITYADDRRLAELLIQLAPYSITGLTHLAQHIAQRWIITTNDNLGLRFYHVLENYGVPFEDADWLLSQEMIAREQYIQVKSILSGLVKHHPTPDRQWLLATAMRYRKDPFQKQIEILSEFIKSAPSDPRCGQAYQYMGDLALEQENCKAGIEYYKKAEEAYKKAGYYDYHIPQLQNFRSGNWELTPALRHHSHYAFPLVVVLDLENDYFPDAPLGSRVFEIGAVRVKGSTELDSCNLVIQRNFISPKVAQRQNEAVPLDQAIKTLQQFIGNSIVAGHNIQAFDAPHLRAMGLSISNNHIIDTLTFARLLYPDSIHHHLDLLRTFHKITPKGEAHTALPDAQACASLLHILGDELLRRSEKFISGFRAFILPGSAFDKVVLQPRNITVDPTIDWDLDSAPVLPQTIHSHNNSPASPAMLHAIKAGKDTLVERYDPNATYVDHLPTQYNVIITFGTRSHLERALVHTQGRADLFVLPNPQTLICPHLLRQHIEQTSNLQLKLTLFCLYQASHNHDASTLYPLRIPIDSEQQDKDAIADENHEAFTQTYLRQILIGSCCTDNHHAGAPCPAHRAAKQAALSSRLLLATHQSFLHQQIRPDGKLIIVDDADQLQMHFAENIAECLSSDQIYSRSQIAFKLLNSLVTNYAQEYLSKYSFHERIHLRNIVPFLTQPTDGEGNNLLEILRLYGQAAREIADTLEALCQQSLQEEQNPKFVHAYWLDIWFSRQQTGEAKVEQWSFCGLNRDLQQAFHEIFWKPYQQHILAGTALALGTHGPKFFKHFFGLPENLAFDADKPSPTQIYIPSSNIVRPASFLAQHSWAKSIGAFLYKLALSANKSLVITLQSAPVADALAQTLASQMPAVPQVLSPYLNWTTTKIAERLTNMHKPVIAILPPRLRQSSLNETVDIEATGPLRFLNQRDPLVAAQMATFAKLNKNEGPFTSYLLPQALLELKARTASPAKIHIILDSALQDKAYRDAVYSLFRESEMIDSLSGIADVPQKSVDAFVDVFSKELEERGLSRHTQISDQDLSLALATFWETKAFRKSPLDQEHVIRSAFEGKDQLVIAATGGGKSLCYQLPAVLMAQDVLPKVTLIFSPLIALMEDQIKALHRKGIFSAIAINSTLTGYQKQLYIKGIEQGDYSIIYIAPEKIRSSALRRALQKREIGLIAFDEAHCVSQWGHNFRTEYFAVKKWVDTWLCGGQKRSFPVLALTATARKAHKSPSEDYRERSTIQDIIEKLALDLTEKDVRVTAPERKELVFRIELPLLVCPHCQYKFKSYATITTCPLCSRRCTFLKEHIFQAKCENLVSLLSGRGEGGLRERWERPYGQCQRGIVFCRTKSETEKITDYLKQHLPELQVDFFYGGSGTSKMSKEKRQDVQRRFMSDDKDGLDVVVATNAFGMGIDVRRLGLVIHFDIPASPEAYYQEAGRAGRDEEFQEEGKQAQCILFYHQQDVEEQSRLMSQDAIMEMDIINVYQAFCKLRSHRGSELLVTEQDIQLLAKFEKTEQGTYKKRNPNIATILYYLENHTLLNGQPILERYENGEELKQLKFEIGYQKCIDESVLTNASQKLIKFFQTSTKFGLNDKELTIIDINELATDLQWQTDRLQEEIKNLIRRQILAQESHCYIQWLKSKRETSQIIKNVEENIMHLFRSVSDQFALQNGKEVLVNVTDLYEKGELSAIPLDTFTSFLSELSHNTARQQLLASFKRALQGSGPQLYRLRLRPPSEAQLTFSQLWKELSQVINRFYHIQEATAQKDTWEFIDILKEATDQEERSHLRWLLHLLEKLELLKIKEVDASKKDNKTEGNYAMRISFKQPCEATDHISIDLFIVRQVEQAAKQKLELMKKYATSSQEHPQDLFRSYFYGEEPLIEPFKINPKLTEEQRAIVTCTEGFHLISGPAGSGKTEVLKEHINYLIKDRLVPPDNILVVTHYQSASDRISNDLEDAGKDRHIKTMTLNALGTHIFKHHKHFLKQEDGQPSYEDGQKLTLLNAKEDEELVKSLAYSASKHPEMLLKHWPGRLKAPLIPESPTTQIVTNCFKVVSLLRQHGIFPSISINVQEIESILTTPKLRENALFYYAIYLHHFIQMTKEGWYTYDDQILFALTILQRYPDIIKRDQSLHKYEHIIIDEFQDLTPAQVKLIQFLSTGRNNVFAVGDEEQDIRPKEIHSSLAEAFTTLSDRNDPPHYLTINFRSVQEILNLAYAVRNLDSRAYQPVQTSRNKTYQPLQTAYRGLRGETPTMIRVYTNSLSTENDYTVDNQLLRAMVDKALHLMKQLPPCDTGSVAFMVARPTLLVDVKNYLQKELKQPFSELSNTAKYQSRSVKSVLAYFRLILDKQQDREMELLLYSCLGRRLTNQIRDWGKSTQEKKHLLAEMIQDNEILKQIGVDEQQLFRLQQHLKILRYQAHSPCSKVWEEIRELKYASSTNVDVDQEDGKTEMENIKADLNDILPLTVQEAIDYVDRHISFVDKDRPLNGLILTTIDHAKSQDFDTVFLLGAHLLDSIWKDKKRWYVSISRARQRFFFLIDGNKGIAKNDILNDNSVKACYEVSPPEQNEDVAARHFSL